MLWLINYKERWVTGFTKWALKTLPNFLTNNKRLINDRNHLTSVCRKCGAKVGVYWEWELLNFR